MIGRCATDKSFNLNFRRTTYDDQRAYFNLDLLRGLDVGAGQVMSFDVKATDKLAISQNITFDKVNISPAKLENPITEQGSFNVLASN